MGDFSFPIRSNGPARAQAPRGSHDPAPCLDRLGRPLRTLRLSVTDRCNLRCAYCMPNEEYTWIPHEAILSYEELARLTLAFAGLGVSRVRLTGGEPLLRRDLPALVHMLAGVEGIRDLLLTTNAVLLEALARPLAEAGLRRVTISLDTLRRDRFVALARRDELSRVLAGIDAAGASGLPLKLNAVITRGINEDELADLIEFARGRSAEMRFIEYMDVGGATGWSAAQVFSQAEILAALSQRYGPIEPLPDDTHAPAERFRLSDGTTFGVIASTTAPFCRNCDRSRVTADGMWYRCLYARTGTDLRDPLRSGAGLGELQALIRGEWTLRADRGAEQRLAIAQRGPFVPLNELRRDKHLEMHTRGG